MHEAHQRVAKRSLDSNSKTCRVHYLTNTPTKHDARADNRDGSIVPDVASTSPAPFRQLSEEL